ncbi:MAG: stage V sporulation T C-terminal domain-containing protein, partial [Anaerostipes sp.]
IFTEKDGSIILKNIPRSEKWETTPSNAPNRSHHRFLTQSVSATRDSVIAAAGPNAKKLLGKLLHEKAEEALSERKNLLMDRENGDFFPFISDFPEVFQYVCLATIISEGDAVGFVCILSIEEELTEKELMVARIGAGFLGKQLEG